MVVFAVDLLNIFLEQPEYCTLWYVFFEVFEDTKLVGYLKKKKIDVKLLNIFLEQPEHCTLWYILFEVLEDTKLVGYLKKKKNYVKLLNIFLEQPEHCTLWYIFFEVFEVTKQVGYSVLFLCSRIVKYIFTATGTLYVVVYVL